MTPLPKTPAPGVIDGAGGRARGKVRGVTGSGMPGFCVRCQQDIPRGVDSCLGVIPGVSHACCGHGICEPYVVLGGYPDQSCAEFDGLTLRGPAAATFFALLDLAVERTEHD